MDIEFDKDKFDKYKYSVTLSVVTFLGVIIAIFAIILPLWQEANKKGAEYESVHQILLDLKKKEQALEKLSTQKDQLDKTSALLSTALPTTKDVGPLFIQLDQLIVDTGGKIKGISGDGNNSGVSDGNSPITNLNKYSYTLPINFDTYSSMKSFIDQSKKALRLIDISSIAVTSSDTGKIDATITINTYARNK